VLAAALFQAAVSSGTPVGAQQPVRADILLRNGMLLTGDGMPPVTGDVAIAGETIIAVGKFDAEPAAHTIDCTGLLICPGFIDLHNHSDNEVLDPSTRAVSNFLTQGCTTIVTGNCGGGPIDVGDYYSKVDQLGSGTNVLHLLPQGSLRSAVMATEQREATDDELRQMQELLDKAMVDGAWGMSTGLIYVPSSYADTDELVALAEVVGRHGGIYASHVRNEGKGLLDSVQEALQIGRRANVPVHISHFKSSGKDSWGMVRTAVEMIEQQRQAGQVVTADQYPYTASSTSLSATCIPPWARAGGREAMLQRMQPDSPESESILSAIQEKLEITDNGHRIQIASYSPHPEWAGRRLDEIANDLRISTLELVHQIERAGGASIVNHSINEEDVRFVMQRPWVATASDGAAKIFSSEVPHPRNYGTFPRKLGYYALGQQVIPLEQAVRSATGLPADILGLEDRGYLRAGYFADVAVLDPTQLIDRSTFEQPHQFSEGIEYLFVNGKIAIAQARLTGALAGRAVRKTLSQ
jgi:N-acyl-D-aspartate/D-glutamate deacylase